MMVPGIDAALFEPIGRVTVNFSMLQGMVEFEIWTLLSRGQRTGQIVTAELSFRRNVELFSCLYRHRFPGQNEDALGTIRNKLFNCEEERNRITHSSWAGGEGCSMRFKTTAKHKGWAMQAQMMSRDDITAIADKIAQTATDLQHFAMRFIHGVDIGDADQG